MTDYRALCAELVEELESWIGYGDEADCADAHAVVDRARDLLAQAEPEVTPWPVPGDAEGLAEVFWGRYDQPEPEGPPLEPRGCPTPGACSCPTLPTVPPELIRALELSEAALADIGDADREPGDDLAWAETRAAQDLPRIRHALARWGRPTIKPVPVAERLPEAEDCDAEGRCWWFCPAAILPSGQCAYWCLAPADGSRSWFTHWLPHHALPIPTTH
jgi:hypothetical protein